MCSHLESPHQGDSNVYTQYTIFNIKKKIILNYSKSAAMGFFSKGLKSELETTVVNEPSVFEPLKVYCNMLPTYLFVLQWFPWLAPPVIPEHQVPPTTSCYCHS